jgi:hypothetical protein
MTYIPCGTGDTDPELHYYFRSNSIVVGEWLSGSPPKAQTARKRSGKRTTDETLALESGIE